MFRLFELVAGHNLKLTAETENAVEAALPRIQKWLSTVPDLWEPFRKILVIALRGGFAARHAPARTARRCCSRNFRPSIRW